MTFYEDTAYNKSRKKPTEEAKEAEAPIIHDTTMNEENQEEDRIRGNFNSKWAF